MTLTLPTPDAGDTARQRFTLELLLQQPVPGPEQLLASRNLLSDALPDVSPDQWRALQAMPIAILVFLGMTIFLIPTFAVIFEDLGAELPAFTQLLVDLSELLRSPVALYAAGAILISIWLLGRFYATHNGRRTIDRLMLKLPLFGELILMTATAQFCRIFSSLTRAGVPILMSMEISSETAGNAIISDAILASRGMVPWFRRGCS